jgi:F-type H+-transporting ATPase subunit epsilon
MAETEKLFKVNIVTPDGLVYSHDSSFIDMRAIDGQRSIMYNHTPLLTALAINDVRVRRTKELNEQVDHIAVNGGYIEFSNNVATIIAESAEPAEKIDNSRAENEKQRAEARIKEAQAKHDQRAYHNAQVSLRRALNRLNVYKITH